MRVEIEVSGAKREFEVRRLALSGDDELLDALETADRMIRPEEYAWAAAFAAGVDIPPPGPERAAVLRGYIPKEALFGPREQRGVMARVVEIAVKRADPSFEGPAPGDVDTFDAIVSALWGDAGKEASPQ